MQPTKLAKDGSRRGGARPGSGRKPKQSRLIVQEVTALTRDKLEEWLPRLLENLKYLADGGYERVEETLEPNGAGDLVAVKRTVSVAEPDRAANQYLIDRLLGRPTERKEVGGLDGQAIPIEFEAALQAIYGNQSQGELPAA